MKTAVKTSGGYIFLDNPLSMIIEQEADVPCDSLKAVFAYSDNFPDISMIFILDDNIFDIQDAVNSRNVLFSGVVDEVVLSSNGSGAQITVYSRSLASLLTDSESRVITYKDPSLDVIVKHHAEPFGIVCKDGSAKEKKGIFTVKKGSSHYKVIQRFCREFLDTTLRIDHKGIINYDLYSSGKTIDFDNDGGIKFGRITISDNRFNRISEIRIYDEKGYCMTVSNPEFPPGDIQRIRCLNLMESTAGTVSGADRIIRSSNSKCFGVQLECPCCLINTLGHSASVKAAWCENRMLYISKIKYISDKNGERTIINLASRGDK